jgi:hypothetical protein
MSFLSALLQFAINEAPHAVDDLKTLNNLTKQIRDIINKHPNPTSVREGAAALTALETVAQQGFQFIASHSSMVASAAKAAKPAAKK